MEEQHQESNFGIGTRIRKKWIALAKIGQGGFGSVYKVADETTGEEQAMKIERRLPNMMSFLELEAEILQLAAKAQPAPTRMVRLVEFGAINDLTSFMVMQLLGRNLDQLRRSCPNQRFTGSTATRLAIQCMEAIKQLHDLDFVHRDVKGANFALGLMQPRFVYIVDFGLARRFRTHGRLIPARPPPTPGFCGSMQYASINAHSNKELGQVDDMWSWFYMTTEFMRGSLPWKNMKRKQDVFRVKLYENDHDGTLFLGLHEHDAHILGLIIGDLRDKKYSSVIDHAWYAGRMQSIMNRHGYAVEQPFDWEEGGVAFQKRLQEQRVVDTLTSVEVQVSSSAEIGI